MAQGGRIYQKASFSPGTVIFNQGDDATRAFIIESGEVEIFTGQGGEKVVRATLHDNALFGEFALIDKGKRSASAVATKDTTCLVLLQYDFDKVLDKTDPFLKRLIELLISRVRKTNEIEKHV